MKLIGHNGLSRVLEIALCALMVVILILLCLLPWGITWVTGRTPSDPQGFYTRYLVILSYSAVMTELVLWQARGILRNVNRGCVFCTNTVHRMRVLAIEFMVLAVFYLATMFWMSKFFMAALFVGFVMVGCTLLVFAELFRQATQYKEENDMTI